MIFFATVLLLSSIVSAGDYKYVSGNGMYSSNQRVDVLPIRNNNVIYNKDVSFLIESAIERRMAYDPNSHRVNDYYMINDYSILSNHYNYAKEYLSSVSETHFINRNFVFPPNLLGSTFVEDAPSDFLREAFTNATDAQYYPTLERYLSGSKLDLSSMLKLYTNQLNTTRCLRVGGFYYKNKPYVKYPIDADDLTFSVRNESNHILDGEEVLFGIPREIDHPELRLKFYDKFPLSPYRSSQIVPSSAFPLWMSTSGSYTYPTQLNPENPNEVFHGWFRMKNYFPISICNDDSSIAVVFTNLPYKCSLKLVFRTYFVQRIEENSDIGLWGFISPNTFVEKGFLISNQSLGCHENPVNRGEYICEISTSDLFTYCWVNFPNINNRIYLSESVDRPHTHPWQGTGPYIRFSEWQFFVDIYGVIIELNSHTDW